MSERRTKPSPRRKRDRGPDWVVKHHEHCQIDVPCDVLCKCECYHTLAGYSTNLPKKGPCCSQAKKSFDRKFEWACDTHGAS